MEKMEMENDKDVQLLNRERTEVKEEREKGEESRSPVFPFALLPPELQTSVFLALDLPSLATAMRVSSTWHDLIDEQVMWKLMCTRDFLHYVGDTPMPDKDCIIPDERNFRATMEELEEAVSHGNEQALLRLINLIHSFSEQYNSQEDEDEEEEANEDNSSAEVGQTASPESMHTESEEEGGQDGQERKPKKRKQNATKVADDDVPEENVVIDWKAFYRQCRGCTNLNGRWIGEYGSHGKELIHVGHKGFHVLATKITGDVNVPAGKPTFRMTMVSKGDKGKGEMHLADTGYIRPRWGRAFIVIVDNNNFIVKWFYGPHPTQHYDTYYERVKEASSRPTSSTPLLPVTTSSSTQLPERTASIDSEAKAPSHDDEENYPKPTQREVTVSGFAFRLVYEPRIKQMRVQEIDNSDEEDQGSHIDDINDHDRQEDEAELEDDDSEAYTELPDLRDDDDESSQNGDSTSRPCGFQ